MSTSALCSTEAALKPYEVPMPEGGADELEHYKLQVKVMTDLINVRTVRADQRREGRGRVMESKDVQIMTA